jgi:hypothetical protein
VIALAGWSEYEVTVMRVSHITPILNVSSLEASFAWFALWGWEKCWDWKADPSKPGPATFGAVGCGKVQIFLCRDGQGGRGRTGGIGGDGAGVWLSVWVDDVDAVHAVCQSAGVEIAMPPRDEPWCVREMHVRHPDGHIFRVGKGTEEGHADDR